MDDLLVWTIVIAFYAPLHFVLPVLLLFVTVGDERRRRRAVRRALLEAAGAFVLSIPLAVLLGLRGYVLGAGTVLLLASVLPLRGVRGAGEQTPTPPPAL